MSNTDSSAGRNNGNCWISCRRVLIQGMSFFYHEEHEEHEEHEDNEGLEGLEGLEGY